MELKIARRRQVKIKMTLQGSSGSGKSMGALLLAYGLCKDWSKIAVIDTENHSISLYAHLGKFSVINITAPYYPEKFIEAIRICERAGKEVIIIDSISHEWDGAGGILEIHSNMTGNSFTAWGKLTPRHNAFVQSILQSPAHIIGTIRSKQDYVLTERNGKQVPEKVGLKSITRDGMDYEFTIVFDLDIKHNVNASKDRTGLFMDKPEFKITTAIGDRILKWCKQGEPPLKQEEAFIERINSCLSIGELLDLYRLNPNDQESYSTYFTEKKMELLTNQVTNFSHQNLKHNGNSIIKQHWPLATNGTTGSSHS